MLMSDGHPIETDAQGFLRHKEEWTPELAQQIATREGITLTEEHWLIVNYVQQYYAQFQSSPAIRPLVKYLADRWGPEKGNSLYLHRLFKEPAKQASKIAGLPKPARCI